MENKNLQELLNEQQYQFKPYFSDRVMSRLDSVAEVAEDSFQSVLDYIFPRLTSVSFSLVVIVFMFVSFSEGSFQLDTILGLTDYENYTQFENPIQL